MLRAKYFWLALTLAAPLACDDEDDGDTNGDSSSNDDDDTGGEGSEPSSEPSAESGGAVSMQGESCVTKHECDNGVCECTTEGKEGEACDDQEACVAACEVCVST